MQIKLPLLPVLANVWADFLRNLFQTGTSDKCIMVIECWTWDTFFITHCSIYLTDFSNFQLQQFWRYRKDGQTDMFSITLP